MLCCWCDCCTTMNAKDYTAEEYYEDFVKDSEKPFVKPKALTQRISKKELYELIARECKYKKHEVQDVIEAFWNVLNFQLEHGREFDFGGIFTARMYKPHPRRLWDNNKQDFKISSARPRLKLQPTPEYARYLWRGIHCPVNYMPAETVNSEPLLKAEFTAIWSQAYDLWYAEDQRRQAKKLEETPTTL